MTDSQINLLFMAKLCGYDDSISIWELLNTYAVFEQSAQNMRLLIKVQPQFRPLLNECLDPYFEAFTDEFPAYRPIWNTLKNCR